MARDGMLRSLHHLLAEFYLIRHLLPVAFALSDPPPLEPRGHSNQSHHDGDRTAHSDEEAYPKLQSCKKHRDLFYCYRVKLSVVAESLVPVTVALADFPVI
jgi:hypothetical protein